MPPFPWPPPQASARDEIPRKWLPAREKTRLGDVADYLEGALRDARYPRWSYSSAPNGFALVAHIEQTAADGTPSPEPARWSTEMPRVGNMDIVSFVKALANALPGHYRVIVFVVTDQTSYRDNPAPTGQQAERWLKEGFERLPDSVARLPYGRNHETLVLVYEFRKVSKSAAATFVENSAVDADAHLLRAGLMKPLTRN